MKKFKDAQYSAKYIGPGYDLVLTNLASRITLILISPKLIKEFYQLDGSPVYIKEKTFITSVKRLSERLYYIFLGGIMEDEEKIRYKIL
jgi:hypothetical protein